MEETEKCLAIAITAIVVGGSFTTIAQAQKCREACEVWCANNRPTASC